MAADFKLFRIPRPQYGRKISYLTNDISLNDLIHYVIISKSQSKLSVHFDFVDYVPIGDLIFYNNCIHMKLLKERDLYTSLQSLLVLEH